MRRKRKIMVLGTAILCGLIFWPAPAEATLITIAIEAVVDDVQDPDNYLEGRVNIDDLITGTYIYDTDTPDSSPLPEGARYEHFAYPCGFSLNVGGFDFMTDPANTNFLVEIGDNASSDDFYIAVSYNNLPLSSGTGINNIRFVLGDPSETALSSTELPTTAPVLDDWAVNYISIGGGGDRVGFSFSGHATSVVVIPEPTTVLLVGLGGLIFVQRAKK